jgi:type IV secretory pathway VirB10-like protein
MVNTRIGLAVLGASCLVAAGGGGFLATRYNAAPPAQATATAPAESGSEAPGQQPVQETEAVMDEPVLAKDVATPSARPEPEPNTRKNAENRPEKRPAAGRERAPRSAAPRNTTGPTSAGTAAPARVEAPAPARTAETTTSDTRPEPERPDTADARGYDLARRVEPVEQPKWQEPKVDELVVSADSVIGLQLKNTVSSETSQVEDRVEAQVVRDVAVGGRVAIPAGSRVLGAVTVVDRGGKMRDRARLGVRFHTLVLADGTTLQLQTDTVYRDGDSPASSSAAKMGGAAVGGAILGAILGGGKGAVIGGATGAAGGTAAVMAGSRKPATMASGSTVTVRVLSPVTVPVEH